MPDTREVAIWTVSASADNALATASKAAEAAKRHYITAVGGSFSNAVTRLLQIKKGTDVIWEQYVVNSFSHEFARPIQGDVNELVSAELAASGTAGQLGKVNITGYTR